MTPLLSDIASRVDLLGPMLQLLTSQKMAAMDVLGALEDAQKLPGLRVINVLLSCVHVLVLSQLDESNVTKCTFSKLEYGGIVQKR